MRPLLAGRLVPGLVTLLLAWSGRLPATAAAQQAVGSFVGWGAQTMPFEPSGARYKAVAAGGWHSLALRQDGVVVAWGNNRDAPCDTYPATVPAGLTGVVAIAAAYQQSLALKQDGTVAAWGCIYDAAAQDYGEPTVPPGLSGVTAIAAGWDHGLALKQDGTVVGWGDNEYGQSTMPAGLSGVIGLAAGAFHSLALKQDGTVVAWGDNEFGQSTVPAGLSGVIGLAAGAFHSLALKRDGTVVAWGSNVDGGDQSCGQASVPQDLSNVVAIAAGDYHSLALKQDGTVVAWGAGAPGRTEGSDNSGQATVPAGLSGVIGLAGGYAHSLALKQDGTIVAWGDNTYGQGMAPGALSGLTAISAGAWHSLALRQDGTVVAWGINYTDVGEWTGQSMVPDGLSNVLAVAAGQYHSLALERDGTVVAWGAGGPGATGQEDAGQATVPAGLSNVLAIAAGGWHSLALEQDGTVVAWGDNFYGQTNVPAGLNGVIAIAAGQYHSLALKRDGSVVAWGAGGPGQSGDPNFGQAVVPSGVSGVIALAAGWYHSLALIRDGTVVMWGSQTVVPDGLSGVKAIASGADHSLALKQDGTVVAWGLHDDEAEVPGGLTGVLAIAAGYERSVALAGPGSLAPVILAPPLSQVAAPGSNAGLYVLADGVPPLGYQWFFDWTNALSGATNAILDLVRVQFSQSGVYFVVVTNALGAATSASAVLTVAVSPSLVALPTNCAANVGATVDFAAGALGSAPMAYQWFFDGTNALVGATGALLELGNVQPAQSGAYDVVVTNVAGAVTSPPAVLTVMAPPRLVTTPTNQTTYTGAHLEFAVGAVGAPPLGYQWFFNKTNALSGATNAVLDLADVQLSQAGVYLAVVTNPFGAVTSSPAALAFAGPVVVDTTEAALRYALAGGPSVLFACDGTINLASQIAITNHTVLDATGHQITIAPMNPGPFGTNRAFYVSSNVTFTAVNLAISNGCANALGADDSSALRGGAILNDGVLNLRGVSFLNNSALHGGGAVATRAGGTVNAANCTFEGNRAGLDAEGSAAYGGAILNEGGRMSLQTCLFDGNSAQGGSGSQFGGSGNGGAAGFGGAIHNEGNLTVGDCTFQNNSAAGGGGYPWSQLNGNYWEQSGSPGGCSFGGAICNFGALGLAGSAIVSNNAAGGGGGIGQSGYVDQRMGLSVPSGAGGNGGSGLGGGVFNGGTASAVNCTSYANIGTGGHGGQGGPAWSEWYQIDEQGESFEASGPAGPDGPRGSAVGCLCSTNGGLSLTNCTLAFNTASGEANGAQVVGGVSATGAFMVNTLLAANSPVGCASGGIVDGGHNLDSDASCAFTAPTSLSNTDPRLGPLADNGGPTLTLALLPGSPAIGAADSASAPSTDQRGFPRPSGSADIGAYQFNTPLMLKAAQSSGGGLDLSVFGSPGHTCRLLASPDLVNWTAIVTNSFGSLGFFLFHDPAGAGPTQKFYRAVMP